MLKSLELFGFKSFADRTVFEFSRGVTCVVGPNGSGKSNVVDAIKWILGDQSAKSLRGKEMSDVIFNGSASRRPSGFAEATLSFDNSTGLLPIDSSEVQIGRRLYRSGDSEYLLNRNTVRLKDVRDLFMGTGAGTAAYSIIEQGRVDQLLQASPLTRRVVFEEAAGVSRYKAKRVEAERRLERVSQNLERLTDIVDELDTQLSSTRSQASKAARYRELTQELKQLWTGLAADTYRYLTGELTSSREQNESLQSRYNTLTEQCDQVVKQRQAIDDRGQEAEDRQRTLERRQSDHQQKIVSATSSAHHQRSRLEELLDRLSQLRSTQCVLSSQSTDVSRELAETRIRLQESESACQKQRQSVNERREQLRRHKSQVEASRTELDEMQQQFAAKELSLSEIDSQRTRAEHDLQAIRQTQTTTLERLHQHERSCFDASDALEAASRRVAECEHDLETAAGRLQELQSRRAELTNARGTTEDILSRLREDRSAVQARHAVLQDLAQRFYSETGLKNVQLLARQGEHPWNLVVGSVHDLLEVTLEHAPIIEAALVGRSNLIVVRSLGPFLQLIESGELRFAERLGFMELGVHGDPSFDLSNQVGVVDRADRLVFEDPHASGLAAQVLADTWLVESLQSAIDLRSGGFQGARLVTLQGELLDADGALHVGESPIELASIGTKTELRELRNRLARIDRDIVDGDNHIESLTRALIKLGEHLIEQERVVATANDQLSRARTAHSLKLQDYERAAAEVEQQRTAADSLRRRLEELELQCQSLTDQHRAAQHELSSLRSQIEETTRGITETESTIEELQREINTQDLELVKYEERLGTLVTNQARLENEHEQRRLRVADALRQIQDVKVQRSHSTLEILRSQNVVSENLIEVERLALDIRELQSRRQEIRAERNELSRHEEQLQRERRALGEQVQSETLKIRDIETQITGLAERIEEEYQLTLDDLVAQGCSALNHESRNATDADDDAGSDSQSISEQSVDIAAEGDDTKLEWLDQESDDKATASLFEHRREELDAQVQRLRRKIKMMGHVNTEALESLEELDERYTTLAAQLEDLQEAKRALEDIIRRINVESERLFMTTFESIRGHFRELFRKLFGGGEADIILEDSDDVLECGIDIVARPPGKELRSISLLSGGEKTLTAVGMLFAMFRSKPSPYCVLDEVDAALDDANVERYATIVKEFQSMTQFVVITHRKRTMTAADVLYGVTMEQAGVSKRMSVKFEDVSENGDIKSRSAA